MTSSGTIPLANQRSGVTFSLDDLGNWGSWDSGNATFKYVTWKWGPLLAPIPDNIGLYYESNTRNEVQNVVTSYGRALSRAPTPMTYSRSGNLVLDGRYLYSYDAWGRLIQISDPGTIVFNPDGSTTGVIGAIVAHYTYDAFGRLIAKQTRASSEASADVKSELYFHDGVRRIQELDVTGLTTGRTSPYRMDELVGKALTIQREYIYAPNAPPGQPDKFLAQIDANNDIFYILQDPSGDVVSIADAQGRPVAQYSYTPYGTVSAADYFQGYNPSVNTIGHHGLFFDNLIEPWKQGLTVYRPQDAVTYTGPDDDGNGVPDIRQVDFAKLTTYGLYQNRNRTYAPVMGRFLQRDPNASGQVTLSDMDWFGGAGPMSPSADAADVLAMYGDGVNIHAYVQSNPSKHQDPNGLDYADDAIAEYVQQVAGVYETLSQAKAAAFNGSRLSQAYTQMAFAWDDLVWDRDEGAVYSLVLGPFGSRACFVEGTTVATANGFVSIERLTLSQNVTSKPDPSTETNETPAERSTTKWSVVTLRADRGDGSVTTIELLRPDSWVSENQLRAGTTVHLALKELHVNGPAAVQSIEPFPGKVADDESIITARYVTTNTEVVWLFIENSSQPIGVTPSHPIYSADRRSWVAAGDLHVCERLQTLNGTSVVARIEQDPARHTVYNIEVNRSHTYFVTKDCIWVHNTCDPNKLRHIFDKAAHNLQAVLQVFNGSRTAAFTAVEEAANILVRSRGLANGVQQIVVEVKGFAITVRGNVVDGVMQIGTFWR